MSDLARRRLERLPDPGLAELERLAAEDARAPSPEVEAWEAYLRAALAPRELGDAERGILAHEVTATSAGVVRLAPFGRDGRVGVCLVVTRDPSGRVIVCPSDPRTRVNYDGRLTLTIGRAGISDPAPEPFPHEVPPRWLKRWLAFYAFHATA